MDVHEMTKQDSVLVEVNQINENPGPYCMSFGFDLKPLIHSVETFGLINSPIVTKDREGSVEVVVGYRRILALKHLQWKQIPCRDLSHAGFSPLDLLLLNLHDNLTTRLFNAVEKGMKTSSEEPIPPNIDDSTCFSTTPIILKLRRPTTMRLPMQSWSSLNSSRTFGVIRHTCHPFSSSIRENGLPIITERFSIKCHEGLMPYTRAESML